MVEVYSKALDASINVGRLIRSIEGAKKGPTMILTGGIHGNEPSGVFALHQVLNELKDAEIQICGNIYAYTGNLWALERGERFHEEDLNRLWEPEHISELEKGVFNADNEDRQQQKELFKEIKHVLGSEKGPFYFMDLHTTSSETIPFLTVNDSLLNRKFTEQYPVPMILGIEEYLSGPLLSYINELGYVAFGYEGGQHDSIEAIENHIAFVYLSLVFAGVVKEEDIDFKKYYQQLESRTKEAMGVYEIYYRYEIQPDEKFVMKPGFDNFNFVPKGDVLASSNGKDVRAIHDGRVFMPLYQSQGNDGFFAIRGIPRFMLALSGIVRKWRLDRFLPLLPGVRWADKNRDTLIINKKVAKLFAKQLFHLLGYRARRIDEAHFSTKSREAAARNTEYKMEGWFTR